MAAPAGWRHFERPANASIQNNSGLLQRRGSPESGDWVSKEWELACVGVLATTPTTDPFSRPTNPPYDFEAAFRSAKAGAAQVALVLSSPFFIPHTVRIGISRG